MAAAPGGANPAPPASEYEFGMFSCRQQHKREPRARLFLDLFLEAAVGILADV